MKNKSLRKPMNGRRSHKRGTARLFVLSAAFLASTVAGNAPHTAAAQTSAAAAQAGTIQFNIQPGPLDEHLLEVVQKTAELGARLEVRLCALMHDLGMPEADRTDADHDFAASLSQTTAALA